MNIYDYDKKYIMPIKFFSFSPDDHYAYPEIVSSSDNPEDVKIFSKDDCMSGFVAAPYSVIDYDIDESDKPNEEDFEDEEEYEAAYDEWMQNLEHESKKSVFNEYGNYDVYEYLYMISYESGFTFGETTDIYSDIAHAIVHSIDEYAYDSRTFREKMMKDISNMRGVKFILCTHAYPYDNGHTVLAINGKSKDIEKSIPLDHIKNSGGDILKIVAFPILYAINKGDIFLAGSIIASVYDFTPGLVDYIKTQITEEEYENLKKSYKTYRILGRFK